MIKRLFLVLLSISILMGCNKEQNLEKKDIVVSENNTDIVEDVASNIVPINNEELSDNVTVSNQNMWVTVTKEAIEENIYATYSDSWNSDVLLVRVDPDINLKPKFHIENFNEVIVLEVIDEWYKVQNYNSEHVMGWVNSKYLTDINPKPVTLTEFEKKLVGKWVPEDKDNPNLQDIELRKNKRFIIWQDKYSSEVNWTCVKDNSQLRTYDDDNEDFILYEIVEVSTTALVLIMNPLEPKIKYIRDDN